LSKPENKRQREQKHVDDDLDSASGGHCRRFARRRGRIADDDLGFGDGMAASRSRAALGPSPIRGEGSAVATRSRRSAMGVRSPQGATKPASVIKPLLSVSSSSRKVSISFL
jgi:hypothetical protein